MRTTILVCISVFLFVAACRSGSSEGASEKDVQATPQQESEATILPSLPIEKAELLFNECDYIDFIFNDLPVSISQNERSSIQQMIGFISTTPATIKPECSPSANVFFQKDGEDLIRATFYFDSGCYAFIFFENGKPQYGNLITDEGYNYFQKILKGIPKE